MATILAACANGAGSSLLMKMAIENAVKELGLDISKVSHCSIAEAKSTARQYTILCVPLNFLSMFNSVIQDGVEVVGLRNVMSKDEIKTKFVEAGFDQKYKK